MKKIKKIGLKFKIVLAALILFTIYCVISLMLVHHAINQRQLQLAEINQQMHQTETDNIQLSELLEHGIDSEYIIKMAREKLGLVFPGERVYLDING